MNLPTAAERSITEAECRRRTALVQQFAVEHDLAAVVAFSATRAAMWNQTGHVGYIANWSNLDRLNDCVIVVPVQGDPVLLFTGVAAFIPLMKKVSWLKDVRTVASSDPGSVSASFLDVGDRGEEPDNSFGGATRQILLERGLAGRPVGLVDTTNVPHGVYQGFRRALGDLLRDDIPDVFAALRASKTPVELALQREAACLADLAMEVLARKARPDRWGHQVVAEVEAALRGEGADYARLWVCSSPADRWDGLLDLRPHDRLLQDGDQIGACAYVVYAGYWVQAMRCGAIGRPSPALEAAAAVAQRMVDAAMAAARPGLPATGVVEACAKIGEDTGYLLTSPRIGHGHGLDYSERPFLVAGSSDTFRSGNVVVFHPQINDPETGAMRIPLGEVCVVTDAGAEPLTRFPRAPFVAG